MEIDKKNLSTVDEKAKLTEDAKLGIADQADNGFEQIRAALFGALAVLENQEIYGAISKEVPNNLDVQTVIGKAKSLLEYLDTH